jgi:hypothetical protein
MLAESLLRKRATNREIAKHTRQKRLKVGYKGLICYVDKESHAFLRKLKRETDTSSLSDVILDIIRERQARSR